MPIFDEAAAVEAMARAIYGGDEARWQRNQKTQGVGYALHQAKRALAALKPFLGGWRAMESAPKDGTHVLVAHGEIVGEAHFYVDDGKEHEGWYWNDQHWTDAVGGEPFEPSHWQPLPASPDKGGE